MSKKRSKNNNKKKNLVYSATDLLEWSGPEDEKHVYSTTELFGARRETVRLRPALKSSIPQRQWWYLTFEEIRILYRVFGNNLDYNKIRIFIEDVWTVFDYSRVWGNDIHFDRSAIDVGTGKIREDKLIHEAAHVWQYQKTMGRSYATSAIWAWITKGEKAYSYKMYIEKKVPFRLWNSEAQAQWIEDKEKLPDPDFKGE